MNLNTKRYIASWVLLTVFLPTLLLSSLHIHHVSEDETSCTACVQHQCHGHLSQFSGSLHHCVLCQFLTLSFVAGTAGTVVFLSFVCSQRFVKPLCDHIPGRYYFIVTRGPPAFSA
ncbi:MAG: hypothetical protein IJR69_10905 [Bacteroidaceae bacterium]|nr:hypothetical protein [Bacteroidaceae bacterium]